MAQAVSTWVTRIMVVGRRVPVAHSGFGTVGLAFSIACLVATGTIITIGLVEEAILIIPISVEIITRLDHKKRRRQMCKPARPNNLVQIGVLPAQRRVIASTRAVRVVVDTEHQVVHPVANKSKERTNG